MLSKDQLSKLEKEIDECPVCDGTGSIDYFTSYADCSRCDDARTKVGNHYAEASADRLRKLEAVAEAAKLFQQAVADEWDNPDRYAIATSDQLRSALAALDAREQQGEAEASLSSDSPPDGEKEERE